MMNRKCVVVGDGAVGKSSFLITLTTNSFPSEYIPTIFDNFSMNIMRNGQAFSIGLWDTAGQEDYDRLRPLSYSQTDIFLVLFSVVSEASFENIKHKWVPEILHFIPDAPFILIGTKVDLRNQETNQPNRRIISRREGEQMAKDLGAAAYLEISSLHTIGMQEVIDTIIHLTNLSFNKKSSSSSFPFLKGLSFSSSTSKRELEPEILPPTLPPQKKAPYVYIQNATICQDFTNLLNDRFASDVQFTQNFGKILYAHKVVLCSSCQLFRKIFGVFYTKDTGIKTVTQNAVFSEVSKHGSTYVISVKESINWDAFVKVMEFVYSGYIELQKKTQGIADIKEIAEIMSLSELVTMCENSMNEVEDYVVLNNSIGTWLNDRNSQASKDIFFDQKLYCDMEISIEEEEDEEEMEEEEKEEQDTSQTYKPSNHFSNDENNSLLKKSCSLEFSSAHNQEIEKRKVISSKIFLGHRSILYARCSVIATMLTGGFMEGVQNNVSISQTVKISAPVSSFMALLEYLYTEHTDLEHNNTFQVLSLADLYGISRLVNLCELEITKTIDRSVSGGIEKSNLSVISILEFAQSRNAKQLEEFCLHFISSNYQPMKKRKEFSRLCGKNLQYVEENQWPPADYLEKLKEYEKNVKNADKNCSIM